jgi:hypothetical protein
MKPLRVFLVLVAVVFGLSIGALQVAADPIGDVCEYTGPHDCPPDVPVIVPNAPEIVQRDVTGTGALPNAPGGTASGWWRVRWQITWQTANRNYTRYIRYLHASTTRLEGEGEYATEAHGALIRGSEYDGEVIWGMNTDDCAGEENDNAPSVTCSSEWFDGFSFYIVSGHWFDDDDSDRSPNASCDGCLDRVEYP